MVKYGLISLGQQPVAVRISRNIEVKGKYGQISIKHKPWLRMVWAQQTIVIHSMNKDRQTTAYQNTIASVLRNMVYGVTHRYFKSLELVGVGYKASVENCVLVMLLGFSHVVKLSAPCGIQFVVKTAQEIEVVGVDKQLVGQVASQIRAIRPTEPYKGKGVRFKHEIVRLKQRKKQSK